MNSVFILSILIWKYLVTNADVQEKDTKMMDISDGFFDKNCKASHADIKREITKDNRTQTTLSEQHPLMSTGPSEKLTINVLNRGGLDEQLETADYIKSPIESIKARHKRSVSPKRRLLDKTHKRAVSPKRHSLDNIHKRSVSPKRRSLDNTHKRRVSLKRRSLDNTHKRRDSPKRRLLDNTHKRRDSPKRRSLDNTHKRRDSPKRRSLDNAHKRRDSPKRRSLDNTHKRRDSPKRRLLDNTHKRRVSPKRRLLDNTHKRRVSPKRRLLDNTPEAKTVIEAQTITIESTKLMKENLNESVEDLYSLFGVAYNSIKQESKNILENLTSSASEIEKNIRDNIRDGKLLEAETLASTNVDKANKLSFINTVKLHSIHFPSVDDIINLTESNANKTLNTSTSFENKMVKLETTNEGLRSFINTQTKILSNVAKKCAIDFTVIVQLGVEQLKSYSYNTDRLFTELADTYGQKFSAIAEQNYGQEVDLADETSDIIKQIEEPNKKKYEDVFVRTSDSIDLLLREIQNDIEEIIRKKFELQ